MKTQKKDYLKIYADKGSGQKFQEGGAMPPQGAPGPQGGGGGGLEQALMQVVETQDPQLALQVCNKIAEAMGLTGGGGAPAPAGPPAGPGPAGPPAGPEGGMPMGRHGLRLPKLSKEILNK